MQRIFSLKRQLFVPVGWLSAGTRFVLGFTDHDHDVTLNTLVCLAASGFKASEAVAELGLAIDNQEIEGALVSDAITDADILTGRYDGAEVEIWMVNWADPSQQHLMQSTVLGEISQEDHLFRAQMLGLTSKLDQNSGRIFSRDCDAVLGDSRCGVDLDVPAMRTNGEVLQVIDRLTLVCSGLEGHGQNWFCHGQLHWTSGQNAGSSVELSGSGGHRLDQVVLWKSMPYVPAVGDLFELTAGCDKQFSTCKEKFSNHLNFRGFPHVPGADFSLGYAATDVVHDGSALVP